MARFRAAKCFRHWAWSLLTRLLSRVSECPCKLDSLYVRFSLLRYRSLYYLRLIQSDVAHNVTPVNQGKAHVTTTKMQSQLVMQQNIFSHDKQKPYTNKQLSEPNLSFKRQSTNNLELYPNRPEHVRNGVAVLCRKPPDRNRN